MGSGPGAALLPHRTDRAAPLGGTGNVVGGGYRAPGVPRSALDRVFPLSRLTADTERLSSDGTRKFLWRLADGEAIESVLIPSGSRRTLCISSQAGCALGCTFCATGRMGFRRNLSVFEIAGQVREIVLRYPAEKPTNIVFMGMGEPLLNWPAVDTTLTILNSPEGLGIGARHIPSRPSGSCRAWRSSPSGRNSSGWPSRSTRRPARSGAPSCRSRKSIDLEAVISAARAFERRVTFEYVMIAGVNDSDADADQLVRLARRLRALVNILPLHPGGADELTPTSATRIRAFADRLRNQGVEAAVRRSRGLDINAACGQLRVEVERRRAVRTG